MKQKTLKLLTGITGTVVAAIIGYKYYQSNKELNDHITFAEKNTIFWQRKVYNQSIKYFIRLRAYNWNEILRHRDHFIVYVGTCNSPECLNFAPRLSYAARRSGVNIYYLDSTKEMTNPILHRLIEDLHINSKPALLSVDYGIVTQYKFDQPICDFIEKKRN